MKELMRLRIGEVAQQFGISVGMLRHYEAKGLMNPSRDAQGNRVYGFDDIVRLEVILAFSLAGVSLLHIGAMLSAGGRVLETVPHLSLSEQLGRMEFRQAAIAAAVEVLQKFV